MRNLTAEEWALEIFDVDISDPGAATRLAEDILQSGIHDGMTKAARIADGYESEFLPDSPVRSDVACKIKRSILHARDNPKS